MSEPHVSPEVGIGDRGELIYRLTAASSSTTATRCRRSMSLESCMEKYRLRGRRSRETASGSAVGEAVCRTTTPGDRLAPYAEPCPAPHPSFEKTFTSRGDTKTWLSGRDVQRRGNAPGSTRRGGARPIGQQIEPHVWAGGMDPRHHGAEAGMAVVMGFDLEIVRADEHPHRPARRAGVLAANPSTSWRSGPCRSPAGRGRD